MVTVSLGRTDSTGGVLLNAARAAEGGDTFGVDGGDRGTSYNIGDGIIIFRDSLRNVDMLAMICVYRSHVM